MSLDSIRDLKTRIARGLASWLTFEFACKRGYLFSEYYLAHAVGQILRGQSPNVRSEQRHPALAQPNAIGRPPSVDFVLNGDDDEPLVAIETKWAGYSNVTAEALLWDAFRLEAFVRETDAIGLLVFAGTRAKISTLFDSKAFSRTGSRAGAPLLPVPDKSGLVGLHRDELSEVVAKYVRKRADRYPAGAIADQIYSHAPQVGTGAGARSMAFDVYVWRITSGGI